MSYLYDVYYYRYVDHRPVQSVTKQNIEQVNAIIDGWRNNEYSLATLSGVLIKLSTDPDIIVHSIKLTEANKWPEDYLCPEYRPLPNIRQRSVIEI